MATLTVRTEDHYRNAILALVAMRSRDEEDYSGSYVILSRPRLYDSSFH